MPDIVLTDEQARLLAASPGNVVVRRPDGTVAGILNPAEAALFAKALERRAKPPGPRFTHAQVRRHLDAMQAEWERTGGFDEAYMRQFLDKLRADDPPAVPARGAR